MLTADSMFHGSGHEGEHDRIEGGEDHDEERLVAVVVGCPGEGEGADEGEGVGWDGIV